MTIKIKKSNVTFDGSSTATKEELRESTVDHINDVADGIEYFRKLLKQRRLQHDRDKIENIDLFYSDFASGFRKTDWWNKHRLHRHHIMASDHPDVNLIDVIEMLTDCVMAGMARTGHVRTVNIPDKTLRLAFDNTVQLLIDQIKIINEDK